ncbi:hypothetical protein D3C73_1105340 [compost metagenome]
MEEHLFEPGIEVIAPTLPQAIEQWQQQFLAQGDGRIQRHGLIELLVEAALGQVGDGLYQLLLAGLPVALGSDAGWLVEQLAHLADRCAPFQPGQDRFDAFDLVAAIQAVAFGGTLRLQQPVAPLPGAQGYRIHTGAACQFTDGHGRFRLHCAAPGCRGAAVSRSVAAGRGQGACANGV